MKTTQRYADEDLAVLRGEVVSMRVVGTDFFGIARVREAIANGKEHTAAGKLLGVKIGDSVELRGAWTTHAKFGRQFKAVECTVVVASDSAGVIRWISERLPDVGRGRAMALVERFGVPGIWNTIERTPELLVEVAGITPARAQAIATAYAALRGERDRMVRLKGWGLTDAQIARVLEAWGDKAEETLRANPFLLSEQVTGFGFARADEVARRMGLPGDAPSRVRAALVHVLGEARAVGHVYLRAGVLVGMTGTVLGGVDARLIWRELDMLERESSKVVRRGHDEPRGARVYATSLDEAEERVAAFVRKAAA